MLNNKNFIARVSKKAKIYHHWRKTDIPGLFEAICNPGLTRTKSELCDVRSQDRLCEVCKIHI